MVQYILVKAPLRVLYDKIQHKGWGRMAQHKYTVLLLICRFCVGDIFCSDGSGAMLLGRLVL